MGVKELMITRMIKRTAGDKPIHACICSESIIYQYQLNDWRDPCNVLSAKLAFRENKH